MSKDLNLGIFLRQISFKASEHRVIWTVVLEFDFLSPFNQITANDQLIRVHVAYKDMFLYFITFNIA